MLSGVAWSAPPEAPVDSEIAVRILPRAAGSHALENATLDDHPLYRLIEKIGQSVFNVEPNEFFSSTFEGTVIAAVRSQSGESSRSRLMEYFRHQELVEKWQSDVQQLRQIAEKLDYHTSEDGTYPENLESFIDEEFYYQPTFSEGVGTHYERSNGGKDYRLSLVFDREAATAGLGSAPSISSKTGEKNIEPTATAPPVGLVVGVKIVDKARLEEFLNDQYGPSKNGFWTSESSSMNLVGTIRGSWFVFSDDRQNLGPFLRTLNGEQAGWSQNPSFKKVADNITTDAPITVFVDLPKLLAGIEVEDPDFSALDELIPLVGPLGYSVVPYESSQFRVEMFLGVSPVRGSELATFFKGSDGKTPPELFDIANIPWDAHNIFALHYGNTKQMVDSVIGMFPELEMHLDMTEDILTGILGLDARAGFTELIDGSVVMSFERIDLVVMGISSFFTMVSDREVEYDDKYEYDDEYGEEGERTIKVASTAADFAVEEETTNKSLFSYIPATVAFKVPIDSNRRALVDLLNSSMNGSSKKDLYGVEMVSSGDLSLSYAIDGEWMYIAGGGTDRLIRYMLEAVKGRNQTLSSIDSWTRLSMASRGRLLFFGHQKLDAFSAFAKGGILLLGTEFRPLAEEYGRLRDCHSVVTAVPDGVLVVTEVLEGDAR